MSRPRTLALALALGLAAAVPLAGCKQEEVADKATEAVRPVKTMTITAADETRTMRYSGSVRARVETALGFRVPGKIAERRVDIGGRVEPGQVLARLDPTDLELALKAAEANVQAARSREKVAEDGLARARSLNAKGFVADANLDRAQLEADQAVAALDAAISTRDQAANQMAYADLLADAEGIVTDIRADVGQVVAAGQPVMRIARPEEKEIAVVVPEGRIATLKEATEIMVGFWALPEVQVRGRLREISPAADPVTRTYAARIALIDPPATVHLGMSARVGIGSAASSAPIVVPLAAVVDRGQGPAVWVVADNKAQRRPVDVLQFREDGVLIGKGVSAGDLIVVSGAHQLVADQPVQAKPLTAESKP